MTNTRRILAAVLVFCLLAAAWPAMVFADGETSGKYGDNLYWEYNAEAKTLTISGNGAADQYFSVPWSAYMSKIETVVIADGVTTIPSEVFMFHKALKNLHIGKTVEKISDYAFCTNFGSDYGWIPILERITVDEDNKFFCAERDVLFDKSKTTLIKYPGGKPDTAYTVPDTVQKIGYKAFLESDNLQTIGLNNSLSEIADYAFKDCESLISITLPDTLSAIGTDIFNNTAYVNYETAVYTDDALYSGNWLVRVKGTATNIVLKPGTLGILDGCLGTGYMSGYTYLETLFIPKTVRMIPNDIFRRCDDLISINVDENNEHYTSVDGILYNKSKTELLKVPPDSPVTDLNFPDSLTAISKSALSRCRYLETVTVPSSVTAIEKTVFTDCRSLKNITVAAENEYYMSENGVLYDKNQTMLMAVPKKSAVTRLELPDTVTTITESAAKDCVSLTEVIFPNSLRVIEGYAFDGCSNLKSNGLNEGLMQIGKWAFYGCTAFHITKIPQTVTEIGAFAFWETPEEQNPKNWQDGVYFYLDGCLLHTKEDNDYNPEKFEIRDGTRLIAGSAFLYAPSSMTEMVIPKTVRYISDYAFTYNLSKLKTVVCSHTPDQWASVKVGEGNYLLQEAEIEYMPMVQSDAVQTGDSCTVTVSGINLEHGKLIIAAGYRGRQLLDMKAVSYTGNNEEIGLTGDMDYVKIYIWNEDFTPYAPTPQKILKSEFAAAS